MWTLGIIAYLVVGFGFAALFAIIDRDGYIAAPLMLFWPLTAPMFGMLLFSEWAQQYVYNLRCRRRINRRHGTSD